MGDDIRSVRSSEPDGYVLRKTLQMLARRLGRDAFLGNHGAPGLLIAALDPSKVGSGAGKDTHVDRERSYKRTMLPDGEVLEADCAPLSRYHDRVAFLTKRPGNPFPHMVSVGRAMNNDIVLLLGSVSKLQGYFLRDADGWSFTDRASTNGTMINGARIERGTAVRLRDGDSMQFGLELGAKFLVAESLYHALVGD